MNLSTETQAVKRKKPSAMVVSIEPAGNTGANGLKNMEDKDYDKQD